MCMDAIYFNPFTHIRFVVVIFVLSNVHLQFHSKWSRNFPPKTYKRQTDRKTANWSSRSKGALETVSPAQASPLDVCVCVCVGGGGLILCIHVLKRDFPFFYMTEHGVRGAPVFLVFFRLIFFFFFSKGVTSEGWHLGRTAPSVP